MLQYALVPYRWWWVLVWWFKFLRLNPARKFPAGLTGEVSPGGSIGNEAKGVMPSGRTCMYGKHYSLPVAIYHSSIPCISFLLPPLPRPPPLLKWCCVGTVVLEHWEHPFCMGQELLRTRVVWCRVCPAVSGLPVGGVDFRSPLPAPCAS